MGRFHGKRPDRTATIAKRVARWLEPGEVVLAGIDVQSPGTHSAGFAGASGGAHAGAAGSPMTFSGAGADQHRRWVHQAEQVGLDPEAAHTSIWMHLVLTSRRLLLIRCSRLTRRPLDVLGAWPVGDVEAIVVPRGGSSTTITVGGNELRLELPHSQKFLPDVYRELPARWADARGAAD